MHNCCICYFEGIKPPRVALYRVGRRGFYCKLHKANAFDARQVGCDINNARSADIDTAHNRLDRATRVTDNHFRNRSSTKRKAPGI